MRYTTVLLIPKANLEFHYDKTLNVSATDIEQLILRIEQWSSPYHVQAKGVTITVKRLKKEGSAFNSGAVYPSVDQFLQQEPGQSAPLDSIGITFSLLHENMDTGVIENVEAEMTIENLVRTERRLSVTPAVRFFAMSRIHPFRLIVNYTDYVVAKSFQSLFEDWLSSLSEFVEVKENAFLRALGSYSREELFSVGFQVVKIFPVVTALVD